MSNSSLSENFLDNTTTAFKSVVQGAVNFSKENNLNYVATEFFIAAMLKEKGNCRSLLETYGVVPTRYFVKVKEFFSYGYSQAGFTPKAKRILQNSWEIAHNRAGAAYTSPEHLLLAILECDCVATTIISELTTDFNGLLKDATAAACFGSINASNPSLDFKQSVESLEQPLDLTPIENYGVDLTKLAIKGRLDPVIGRDKEIDRLIQTLSRRLKSNPLLIGEPGVGKSAAVEGLAQKIVKGEVPLTLKNKTIFSLDLSSVVAGAKYKGEFEERFKAVLKFVEDNPSLILFIDEIHTLVSSTDMAGAGDILKPALARGDIKLIGATTVSEYRKYIEKDAALERRFQVVTLDEPKTDDCVEIIKGLRDKFEAHHRIEITDEAIKAAVTLSERYIPDRFLPDKAIDLIDEAAAKERLIIDTPPETLRNKERQVTQLTADKEYMLSIGEDVADVEERLNALKEEIEDVKRSDKKRRNRARPFIDGENVAKIISEMTGIPTAKLTQTEAQKLLLLEDLLHKRVIGQEDAVTAVSQAVRRAMTCVKDPNHPIGSFIFVGPTGVGKTELSKALAEALFGDENMLVRIDMSEYMESASINKLIGSPPGYVGYEEEGQLTEKIRRKPYSVVLFDEIEKAHADVFNIMLQLLDEGRLTDSKGRLVDFKNTVVIMTSNEGAKEALEKSRAIGFGGVSAAQENEAVKEKINTALKAKFRPEFLNRIDEIVIFRKLTLEECGKICDIQCENLKKRMLSMNVRIEFESSARDLILEKGYDEDYGARPLKRAISSLVETPLSGMIISNDIRPGNKVKVIADEGEIDFIVE